MNAQPVPEKDLHAYVDGQLDAIRQAEVEVYLAANPAEAERIAAYRKQNEMLHALFDPVLAEGVPVDMQPSIKRRKSPPLLRYAAAALWMVVGGAVGWGLHATNSTLSPYPQTLAQQAAIAHVVYVPEVLHPVEVGADQEAHLVKWLSKRLGTQVKPPHLGKIGFDLVGGRLLPGTQGPAAQFMYQDAQGQRLTLYVSAAVSDNHETAFRYDKEGKLSVFYWVDGPMGYALSGELDKAVLLQIANVAYHELNP